MMGSETGDRIHLVGHDVLPRGAFKNSASVVNWYMKNDKVIHSNVFGEIVSIVYQL